MNNYPPYNPDDPYSQPTTAGSYPQWNQQPPPPPYQPGQFGPPPMQPRPPQKWYQKPFGIVLMLILFFPIGLYLMWRYATWPKSAKWVVTGILALFTICGGIANATTPTQQPMTTIVSSSMTTPLPTEKPTQVPTPTETPTPVPTPTETPTPTQAPVQSQPEQQQQPVQQQPATTGVYGNPWGYDFNPGSKIYNPNSGFCSYFSCVTTFWKDTSGYVIECGNGDFSHSGGISGACSRDGGVQAILYQHP